MEYSKNAIVVPKLKDTYGPIMTSLLKSGIDVVTPKEVNIKTLSPLRRKRYVSGIWFNSTPPIESSCHLGWWMCDLRSPEIFPRSKVDTIFLCNKQFMKAYTEHFGAKVYYIPQCGFDAPIIPGREITWDIVFIGGENHFYHQNRHAYLDVLKTMNFKHINGEKTTLDQKWIYNKTPISIAISPQAEGYTSNRLYNILSSGGFCLTLWFPGIEDLFENKKHLVWFKTPQEMKELIEYYLNHPQERQQIALNGLDLYLKNHTGIHRLDKMLSLLN